MGSDPIMLLDEWMVRYLQYEFISRQRLRKRLYRGGREKERKRERERRRERGRERGGRRGERIRVET